MRKFLLAAAVTLLCLTGVTPVMAIDFDQKIVALDGTTVMDEKGQPIVITIGTVCINALMNPQPGDEADLGEDKIKRNLLAEHILKRDDYKFSVEELALLKKRVNKANPSPLVVRQTWEALEKR